MPSPLLIDLDSVDLSAVCLTKSQIYEHLPHRHEFMVLDGVCHVDTQARQIISYQDSGDDSWWVRGHVPGRPILPGVLMLEMAGQTTALYMAFCCDEKSFIAYGGVEKCKFRSVVLPGQRMYFLCVLEEIHRKRVISRTQGITKEGKLLFEATVSGLRLS